MDFAYNQYMNDVLSGRILTCRMIKLAVKRHQKDLKESSGAFPYVFSDKHAQNAIAFFCEQVHTKGKLARTKLKPEPWQQWVIAMLYGWRRKDNGKRRFRRCYLQVARKNGKTFFAAGVGLYDLISEPGAEVVSAATKRDQAKIAFTNAKNTVRYSATLAQFVKVHAQSLTCGDGMFNALSSDSKMQDGLNPSCAIIDEYHAHKTDELLNVIESGMGARQQPLIFIITTAGHELSNPCHEEYERVCKMLEGARGYENDNYLAVIYELDKGDDPENERNWIKANPNLDVDGALSTDELRKALLNARQKSSGMAEFLTKRMDIWINNADCWIDDSHWRRCMRRFSEKNLKGLKCWGALDLSKTTDFTAFTLYFQLDGGKMYARHRFYIPQDMVAVRMKTDTYLVEKWVKDGFITATPGETVDYSYMFEDIRKDAQLYDIQEIAYDRNLSSLIIQPLSDSFNMVEFNQGITYMSEPSKAWEKAVSEGRITDNNPVMRWMVSCATIKTDANDNIKVVKPQFTKSSKRIDGVITSIMAMNRLETAMAEEIRMQNLDIDKMIF